MRIPYEAGFKTKLCKRLILTKYNREGVEAGRSLVEFDGEDLVEHPAVTGLVSFGALIDDTLYYTVYEEKDNTYSLYEYRIEEPAAIPSKLEEGLSAGELYAVNGELFKSSVDTIYNDRIRFVKKSLNYFDEASRTLIQIYPDANADLVLQAIDMATGKAFSAVTGIIDFRIQDGILTAYGHGKIETIPLPKGKG